MPWLRNLLFLALVGGGVATLAANLLPPRQTRLPTEYESAAFADAELMKSVAALDAAFADHWRAAGVEPAAAAPELAVARRLALGLAGTVPSLEELRRLEALPPAQRLPWYADHLLGDRRSADYLAERTARAAVGTEDGPFIFFRRRRMVTWLSDQIHRGEPYDAIVRQLIAGDGLWTDSPATNFVSVTARPEMGNQPDPVRLAGRVTRAFLGLRLDCAQCHDHPFAPWKQTDFEALAAFFGQTHIGFGGVADGGGEFEAEDRKTQVKYVVPEKVPFAPDLLPKDGTRRERLAEWVTSRQNAYFARASVNRVWAVMAGRPLVDPVDNLPPADESPGPLNVLAADFAAHGYDVKRLARVIAASRAFRLDSATEKPVGDSEERAWAVFPLTRLRPEQVAGALLQSAAIQTLDADTHVLKRLVRYTQQNNFVTRYGDAGDDEFDGSGGTIPQRLLMMNGELLRERTQPAPLNAATRIAVLTTEDAAAVEAAYLAVLTRRPTVPEAAHFAAAMARPEYTRPQRVEDVYWALLNATEFAWNH